MRNDLERCGLTTLLIVLIGGLSGMAVLGQGPVRPVRSGQEKPLARPLRWDAGLTVATVEVVTIGGRRIESSTQLKVDWRALTGIAIDHYEIDAVEMIGSSATRVISASNTATLTGLKAGTEYQVTVKACHDAACHYTAISRPANGATSAEYWQIQGTGNSYTTATRVVADGNIGAHGFRYGSWAGPELGGRLRLYYNPLGAQEKGAKPALTSGAATSSIGSVNLFTATSGYGMLNPCPTPAPGQPAPTCPGTGPVKNLALFQAVPMSGQIRFFFEAMGTDQRNRILQIDSQDGYVGRDFNRGARTICQTIGDYGSGGECEARVVIGVEGDPVESNPGIQHARQFKIAYPTLDPGLAGRWDGAAGTAMILTVNLSNQTCSPYGVLQGYAIWDGSRWRLQYQANGCPKLFEQMQAPNPVHLGGTRYKLYYNNSTNLVGQPVNPLTQMKVMKMIYADARRSGEAATLDFEDWELTTQARDIFYLWPDGSLVNDENESKLDDHVTILPTADPSFQVIYSNMSSGQLVPFIGLAVLLNP